MAVPTTPPAILGFMPTMARIRARPCPQRGRKTLKLHSRHHSRRQRTGKFGGRVHTRFPPEPNGYLHVGHAKSICLNFGLAQEFGGKCNLRFDDTNPSKEETEYVDSIIEDVRWLGFEFEDRLYYASDYFDQLYAWAVQLIKQGQAYVCDLTPEQMREYRGTRRSRAVRVRRGTAPLPRTSTYSNGCARANSPTARGRSGRRSTWRRRISTCATRSCTASSAPSIIGPATSGASIRCTITRTANRIRSRESRTRSARSNSRIIGRCTTGTSKISASISAADRIRRGSI